MRSRLQLSWRARLVFAVLAVPLLFALWSRVGDRCNRSTSRAPSTFRNVVAQGPLSAGAGEARIDVPFPVTLAGYGPPRQVATRANLPLSARAVVLQRRGIRIGIVNVDALLIPHELADEMHARASALGLLDVLVVATHAHTSLGGYDDHLVPEVAALGRYRDDVHAALLSAMTEALRHAAASVRPADVSIATAELPALVRSRDPGQPVDDRLTRVGFFGEKGAIAQLVIFSAHPTTAGRAPGGVDPDYPGRLVANEEAKGHGVTLFLPGAVGNASATDADPERYARAVGDALAQLRPVTPVSATPAEAGSPHGTDVLHLDLSHAALPHPDARRLVPWGFRQFTEDFLCAAAPPSLDVPVLDFGPLRLVAVPGEPTAAAAREIEQAAGPGARVISLANGYLGYIDTPANVRAGTGESKRQYFGPELLDRIVQALKSPTETL